MTKQYTLDAPATQKDILNAETPVSKAKQENKALTHKKHSVVSKIFAQSTDLQGTIKQKNLPLIKGGEEIFCLGLSSEKVGKTTKNSVITMSSHRFKHLNLFYLTPYRNS